MQPRSSSTWFRRSIFPGIYLVVITLSSLVLPEMYPQDDAPYLLLRMVTIIHWILLLVVTGGLGLAFLRVILKWTTESEMALEFALSSSFGFGLLAASVSALGFLQILSPFLLQAMVVVLLALLSRYCELYLSRLYNLLNLSLKALPSAKVTTKLLLIFTAVIIILTMVNTLTPPWDYDGLMYHLPGPRQYLDAGGFFPDLDNWYVNGPFSIEMLFTIGLSLGDDVLPKLIHFTFWLLLGMASYAFARRWYSHEIASLTLALILGVPALPIWAGFAYIDIGWSLFEFLALACLLSWWKSNEQVWLILSSSFAALAVSAKYLGLFGAAITGLLFLYILMREHRRLSGKMYLTLGLPVLVIGLPWYVKNALWFLNPVYPLIWGGPAWDPVRLHVYNGYLGSFGKGDQFLDFLLLPWNVYAHNELFGAVFNRNDIPHVLFLLAPLAPLLRKDKWLKILGIICLLRIGIWFVGSQQIRFLLPIYPLLALLSAVSIHEFSTRFTREASLQLVLPTLSVVLIFIPIFYQIQIIRQYGSFDVLTGRSTRDSFLINAIGDYAASKFIQEQLPDSARVLMLGNGRSYYCEPQCLPDPDHFHRARQIVDLKTDASLSGWVGDMQASHIQISIEDLDFLLQHDPDGMMRQAFYRISAISSDDCFSSVYSDRWIEVYENLCHP